MYAINTFHKALYDIIWQYQGQFVAPMNKICTFQVKLRQKYYTFCLIKNQFYEEYCYISSYRHNKSYSLLLKKLSNCISFKLIPNKAIWVHCVVNRRQKSYPYPQNGKNDKDIALRTRELIIINVCYQYFSQSIIWYNMTILRAVCGTNEQSTYISSQILSEILQILLNSKPILQ